MEKLEQYFKGEKNWLEYSNLFEENQTNSDFQLKLLEKCNGKPDIAKVIFHHLRENSVLKNT